ncbi:hypothetical protein BKA69DRAFT_1076394 [Paraphysoderma sedebokerense]|nr:hypothetical protein BKA69DRAFT_1076347 [Paraphysoderma sedebokerense]KAI9141150.1 hypothetical protein BKA69DRAFT_1076394 [Paraphysoderma sedebokerense]
MSLNQHSRLLLIAIIFSIITVASTRDAALQYDKPAGGGANLKVENLLFVMGLVLVFWYNLSS